MFFLTKSAVQSLRVFYLFYFFNFKLFSFKFQKFFSLFVKFIACFKLPFAIFLLCDCSVAWPYCRNFKLYYFLQLKESLLNEREKFARQKQMILDSMAESHKIVSRIQFVIRF